MKRQKTIWGLLGVMVWAAWASSSPATLVGYWNFNEGSGTTAVDLSGFVNTGTLGPTAGTLPAWTATDGGHTGLPGDSALSFDGSNDRVTVADSTSLRLGGAGLTDAMTVSAWVKLTAISGSDTLVTKSDNNYPKNWMYRVTTGAGDQVNMFSDAGTYTTFSNPIVTGASPPTAVWAHLAMVLQENGAGTTSLKYYINGVQYGTTQTSVLNFGYTDASPLLIGDRADNVWQFNGAMDDLAIWNTALSPLEISRLASGSSPLAVPEPSTVLLLGLGAWVLARGRVRR